jgi:glucan phosphorylase
VRELANRIHRLNELANDLWWSWNRNARNVFRRLDYPLWRLTAHNPVKMLSLISNDALARAVANTEWLQLYDEALAGLDAARSPLNTWCAREHPSLSTGSIAYFSAEFALHQSLPIYAGGLGVLAGDHCKEASDLGVPLIGVGFMYPQGYFHQVISPDGWQEERYEHINWNEAPVEQALTPDGKPCVTAVPLGDRTVLAAVWRVRAGRVSLFLLDTDLQENAPRDRDLSARLYGGDRWATRRCSTTSTKAMRPSSCCSASTISARRAPPSTERSPTCAEPPCSPRTRRWRPGTTLLPFPWWSRISPASGATSVPTASASCSSGTTTTARAPCST